MAPWEQFRGRGKYFFLENYNQNPLWRILAVMTYTSHGTCKNHLIGIAMVINFHQGLPPSRFFL